MPRVLLADDDAEQLLIRAQFLKLAGHETCSCVSVAAALVLLEDFQPDFLVMDLAMPKLGDGLHLIRTTAARAAAPRIIVLSGWPEQLEGRPEASLVAAVLPKPAPLRNLLDAIGRLT
jgi:CheY-like chemotaxis protein